MNSAMAPIYTALGVWGGPGVAVFSLIILLILTITFLALCTRCQRQSFDLEQNPQEERNTALVRVVQLETVASAEENTVSADITQNGNHLHPLPEDEAVKPTGEQEPRSWRVHTLDDRHDLVTSKPNINPTVTEHPVMEASLRSVEQNASTHTDSALSTDKTLSSSELPDFQTVPLEDQTDETDRDLSTTLPYNTHHMYETIGEKKSSSVSVGARQSETLLNPYAEYDDIMKNGFQENGSNVLEPPMLAEEQDEEFGRRIIDTYAIVSRRT